MGKRRVLVVLFGALFGLFGAGAAWAVSLTIKIDPSAVNQLLTPINNLLSYDIHTKGGPGCGTERTVLGYYGVPTPVDVGGSSAPDVLVTIVPIPAIQGVTPTRLSVTIDKLASGPLPALVEAIVAPSQRVNPSRVALGYDGCGSTAPQSFSANVTSTATQLTVDAKPSGPGADLAVLGSVFTQKADGTRGDPTAVRALVSPVPSEVNAVVDFLANSTYHANVTSTIPTHLALDYTAATATSSTVAHVVLDKLPAKTDVTFGPGGVSYDNGAPIDTADVDVTLANAGARTKYVHAHLTGLPATANFTQADDNHAAFSTPDKVTTANVRFARYDPGTALPALPTGVNQFARAEVRPHFDVYDVQAFGVSSFSAGWGDDILLDLTHAAGPVDITDITDAQTVTMCVRDLPATVHLTYTKATETVTYHGSSTIGAINFDLVSVDNIGGTRANLMRVDVASVPTDLTATLDTAHSTFNATMTNGALGAVDFWLTNGLFPAMPKGGDGLMYLNPLADGEEPSGEVWIAHAHMSHITKATVGWGDPLSAVLDHTAAPFELDVQLAKNPAFCNPLCTVGPKNTHTVHYTITGLLTDLPSHVEFAYSPGKSLTYDNASAPMNDLRFDVSTDKPLFPAAPGEKNPDPTFTLSNHLDIHLIGLPKTVHVDFDEPSKSMTATLGANQEINSLAVTLSTGVPEVLSGVSTIDGMGVSKVDRLNDDLTRTETAFVRLTHVKGSTVGWGDATHLVLDSDGGFLPIRVLQQSLYQEILGLKDRPQTTVDVDVNELPAHVDLTFDSKTQAVTYQGSDDISNIDATVTRGDAPDGVAFFALADAVKPFAGRGTTLRLILSQVPMSLHLTQTHIDNSDDDKTIGAQLGTGERLPKVDLWITDGQLDTLLGADGLLIEDLTDRYVLFAQATNFNGFQYKKAAVASADDDPVKTSSDYVDFYHQDGPDLTVSFKTAVAPSEHKVGDVEFLEATVYNPPDEMHLHVDKEEYTDLARHYTDQCHLVGGFCYQTPAALQTSIFYNASAPSDELSVTMNKGDSLQTDVTATPLPANASMCFSTTYTVCSPHFTLRTPHEGTMSAELSVDQPVIVTLVDQHGGDDAYTTNSELHIEKYVNVMHQEEEDTGANSHWVGVDTHDGYLRGFLHTKDLRVDIPDGPHGEGLHAGDRLVRVQCKVVSSLGDCSDADNIRGVMACPPGFQIHSDAAGGVFGLATPLCSAPVITGVVDANGQPVVLHPGDTDRTIYIQGAGGHAFSPGAVIDINKLGQSAANVIVDDVEWVSYASLKVKVDVAPGAPNGPYYVYVRNWGGGGESTLLNALTTSS